MDGLFACPECGGEVSPAGLSPGRRVRCGWCRTWVEVPFLPRAEQVRSLRRLRDPSWRGRWPRWARGAVTALAVAIAAAGAWRVVRSERRKAEAEAVARLVESSREAETSGRLGEALATLEGALSEARALRSAPADIDDLRRHRDLLSRREAEAQLAALAAAAPAEDPGRAVGRALTLLARAAEDPALEGLEPAIRETLERLRARRADADADAAEAAFAAGQPANALGLAQRSYLTAAELSPAPKARVRARVTELARRVIEGHGTTFAKPQGQFTLGSPEAYARRLAPPLKDALRAEGYLPQPPEALWDDLWASRAPYRVTIEVKERQAGTYLQSQNRITAIDATVTLSRQGRRVWQGTPSSRTQVPIPGLPAYQASRFSLSPHPSPEFERLLYEDARDGLIRHLGSYLHRLPACPTAGKSTPPGQETSPGVL